MLAHRLLMAAGGSGSFLIDMFAYDYVIAANDTAASLKAEATVVCDGTADEAEINTAITAAVASARPYSILLLPGTFLIADRINFLPLTGMVMGNWLLFEASASTIRAAANMTTMIDLAPAAGGQIVTCLDARFGVIDGASATRTVTQLIKMCRFSDNRLRVNDLLRGSGHGVSVQTASVADYPTGNNQLEFNTIRNMTATAFHITAGTNAYGFTGNQVFFGQIIACANGFIMGSAANQNAVHNKFVGSVIEGNTSYGIYDYSGGNFWYVNNTNSNGTKGIGCPSGMTQYSTFVVNIDDSTDAAVLSQHYVLSKGRLIGQS